MSNEKILGFMQSIANQQVSKPKKQVEVLTLKKEYNITPDGVLTEDKISSIEREKYNASWE
jgi:hypothetical protein